MTRQLVVALTRLAVFVWTLLIGAAPLFAQDLPTAVVVPLASNQEMRQRYIWSTLGVNGALRAAAFGSYDEWRGNPSGWEQTPGGLAKRVSASYAWSAIGDATNYAVARALHQDPSFTTCDCAGLPRRVWHAIAGPFTARNRDGARVASPTTIGGIVAGHVVAASTWYPAPFAARDVLGRSAVSLALTMGMNVVREFRPRPRTPDVRTLVAVEPAN